MNLVNKTKSFVKYNSSTILTCVGATGVIVTSVMAAKATPKALRLLELAEKEKGEELSRLEVVKIAGPSYIPAVLVGVSTIACIFGANALNKRQQASLMSAYALIDNSYKEYRSKVTDVFGEDADEKVRSEIAKDKYKESDIDPSGDSKLFFDIWSMRYFESTTEKVLEAESIFRQLFKSGKCACINDLYDLFGLPPIDGGHHLGWSYANGDFDIGFKHDKTVTDDGLECCIISYTVEPYVDYMY